MESGKGYRCSLREKMRILVKSAVYAGAVGFLFYDSAFVGVFFFGVFLVLQWINKRSLIEARKRILTNGFKEALAGISAALTAGYSAENAVGEALKDLRRLYPETAPIVREFTYMTVQMSNGSSVEEAFFDFAERSGVEDIKSFAEIFSVAKRGGGNMIAVLKRSIEKISRKIEIKNEIHTALAAKQYESLVLKGMPFVIILYMRLCSPDFLEPLYHNTFGILVMSALLVIYAGCAKMADKLMEIEV